MTILKISSFVTSVLIIAACHSTKKTESTASTTPAASTAPAAPVSEAVKSKNGVFAPGEEQVTAIQIKHPGTTLVGLNEGYAVYTGASCIECHKPKGIYRISEDKWPHIIENMGKKAKLSAAQKDALTKYVFAIKATQPAGK